MSETRTGVAAFPVAAGVAALAVAALALAGWVTRVEWLYRVSPRLVAMNPATAIAIGLAALALLALRQAGAGAARRRTGVALAAAAAMVGGLRLVNMATGLFLVDLWLFPTRISAGNSRMMPSTAAFLVLLGYGLMRLDAPARVAAAGAASAGTAPAGESGGRRARPAAFALAATAAFSFAVLVAYAYLGTTLIQPAGNGMALNTALCLVLLAAGGLTARPHQGLMPLLGGKGDAAVLARRLILATTLIPLLLGWLRNLGQHLGWYRAELGVALMAAATVLLLGGVVWAATASLASAGAQQRRALEALSASERRFRQLFEASPSFICTHDEKGVLLAVNPAAAHALDYQYGEMCGRRFTDFMTAESAARFADHLEALRARKRQEITIDVVRRDGEQRTWLYIEQRVEDPGAEPYTLGHALDVTARRLASEELAHQAFHDHLTGIGNRALFDDRLALTMAQARRHRRRLAVFYLDLDGFKPINDTYGHDAGDHVLRQIAARISGNFRQEDTLARLGGDEFGLLLLDIGISEAIRIGESLLHLIAQPVHHNGEALQVTASLGISFFPDNGDSQEALLRAADRALYRSKAEGRGQLNLSSSVGQPLPLTAN